MTGDLSDCLDLYEMSMEWDFADDSPRPSPSDPEIRITAPSHATPSSPLFPGGESTKQTSVVGMIEDLVGTRIQQKDLLTLRQGIFAAIFPPISRNEKRLRPVNAGTFEKYRYWIAPMLCDPTVRRAIVYAVLHARGNREREVILSHLYRDQLNKA
jgi:hypothetical protein